MLTIEIAILLLLLVACLSSVSFKRINFPYTVGLVIIGFGLGFLKHFGLPVEALKDVVLSPDLILFIFVPPLIFESAINLENRLLVRNLTPILTLAGPGLVVSMLIIGVLMVWLTPLSWGSAMLFGALISATDPVAVIALFKEVGVAKRLTVLVEGESMLNDATAIVAFELVLFILTSGALEENTGLQVLVRVSVVLLGGLLVGWVMGTLLGYAMILAKDDGFIQATVSVIVAYMTFIVAEHFLKVSGVIAVMTAGLVLGRYKSRRLSPKVRIFFQSFWEYAAFLANSLIFLLVGLHTAGFVEQLQIHNPQHLLLTIALAIAVVMVARAVIVFSLIPPLNRFLRESAINWRYQTVIFWGGLRGAVALALVLSLDRSFADRELLIALTLGVALFTIIVCGTTISGLIHRLRLDEPTIIERLAEAQAFFLARQETVDRVDALRDKEPFQEWVLHELKHRYQSALRQAENDLEEIWATLNSTLLMNRQALWLQALALEQQGYQRAFDERLFSEHTLGRLQVLLELKREAVFAGEIPPPMFAYKDLETQWEKMLPGFTDSNSLADEMMHELLEEQASDWVQQRQHMEMLRGQYEYDMAIFEVSEQVARQMNELGKQQAVDAMAAQACGQVYWTIRKETLERLQGMAEQQPTLVLEVQRRIIQQGALERAERLLENLAARGIISTMVAEKARARLESEERRETGDKARKLST